MPVLEMCDTWTQFLECVKQNAQRLPLVIGYLLSAYSTQLKKKSTGNSEYLC